MTFLADLPDFEGTIATPEREGFRARLLARDSDTLREKQRADVQRVLTDLLNTVEHCTDAHDCAYWRAVLIGAAHMAIELGLISQHERERWSVRAWEASR